MGVCGACEADGGRGCPTWPVIQRASMNASLFGSSGHLGASLQRVSTPQRRFPPSENHYFLSGEVLGAVFRSVGVRQSPRKQFTPASGNYAYSHTSDFNLEIVTLSATLAIKCWEITAHTDVLIGRRLTSN
ncbi:hypothetical protein EVAR_19278_1 [Eumeta japonica]|uniref:Uncharacterized protein n=1 Tax=Eumeta variegata TaxID=151549 RepID=A0A4C1UD41_EUMVA|nr:hypothetical protein EVAR_19278_1 [Eumeta japonica]